MPGRLEVACSPCNCLTYLLSLLAWLYVLVPALRLGVLVAMLGSEEELLVALQRLLGGWMWLAVLVAVLGIVGELVVALLGLRGMMVARCHQLLLVRAAQRPGFSARECLRSPLRDVSKAVCTDRDIRLERAAI